MSGRWRLLLDAAADGPWNMAVDALLLERARRGRATVRLYGWRGPWLSLGYAQRFDAARRSACSGAGVGVVRRITGGRAVLHAADLTYALAAPETALPEGLSASYGLVSDILLAGLARLGISAERSRDPASGRAAAFDCFAEPAPEEICAEGRKLCGSAQRRAGGALLQHGSLRLRPDPPEARIAALGEACAEGRRATSLEELGFRGTPAAVQQACVAAFEAALGPFEAVALESADLARARALASGALRLAVPPTSFPAGIISRAPLRSR